MQKTLRFIHSPCRTGPCRPETSQPDERRDQAAEPAPSAAELALDPALLVRKRPRGHGKAEEVAERLPVRIAGHIDRQQVVGTVAEIVSDLPFVPAPPLDPG